jgi:probable HAF family extracellular repeat protein
MARGDEFVARDRLRQETTDGRKSSFCYRLLGAAMAAVAALASAGIATVAAAPAVAADPTPIDLGTLGCPSQGSFATAVDGSIVVGYSYTAGGPYGSCTEVPFAYNLSGNPPAMIDLGSLGDAGTFATAASGSIVVGDSYFRSGAEHAFAYNLAGNPAAMVDLGSLVPGIFGTQATAVSGNIVVGQSNTGGVWPHAFSYNLSGNPPAMVDLGDLGGGYSGATAVSGNIIVGSAQTAGGPLSPWHAFYYDLAANRPAMVDLGTLGGLDSAASAVTGDIIVGQSSTPSGQEHAFAYNVAANPPALVDLGAPAGGYSNAIAVSGDIVVGNYYTHTASGFVSHAFAYNLAANPPAMVALGDLGGGSSSVTAASGNIVVGSSATVGNSTDAVAWVLPGPTTTLQLHISAPYQDNGVTVVSLWWAAPPGATSFSLTADENTGIGPYSYTAVGLPQALPSWPFVVQVEGATPLHSVTFQVKDDKGDISNTIRYP